MGKLAAIHCTMEEIAAVVECSVDTLERRFAEVIKRERDKGKTSLRRKQFEVALSGNVTALIWLGKQCLGQRDRDDEDRNKKPDLSALAKALADQIRILNEERDTIGATDVTGSSIESARGNHGLLGSKG